MKTSIALVMLTLVLACQEQQPALDSADQMPAGSGEVASELPLAAPTSMDDFFARLPEVRGEFSGSWALGEFTGDRAFLAQVHEYDGSVVTRLVDCLDREELSKVKWQGRQISIGALCYAVLRNTAYFESYDDPVWVEEHGQDAPWPGHLELDASPAELLNAQKAWEDVVQRGVFRRA